jgi:sec-independent protein translocase protein TatA
MGLDNPLHIAFLLIVALMIFGAKRLPELGRSLGSGLRGFKDALAPEAGHGEVRPLPEAGAHAREHPEQERPAA